MIERQTTDDVVPDATATFDAAVVRQHWQFSLRAMLLFTAAVACVMLLVTIKGPGVLVVATGLAVSGLNWRGALAGWQRPDRCAWPVRVGWFLLVASLFLPSLPGCNNSQILGWQAAQICAEAQVNGITQGIHSPKQGLEYVVITSMNLTNILLLTSPWFLLLLQRGRGSGYAAAFACCATFAWACAAPDPMGLLIGYYVWCLAQLSILSAARLGPRTLVAMAAVAVLRVFFWPEP
jgi:hypothetical protein